MQNANLDLVDDGIGTVVALVRKIAEINITSK